MQEGYNRRERTAKELLDAERDHRYLAKFENLPNGCFTFELAGQEYGINETFRDSRKAKLESELGRIVAAFVDAVKMLTIHRSGRPLRQNPGQSSSKKYKAVRGDEFRLCAKRSAVSVGPADLYADVC